MELKLSCVKCGGTDFKNTDHPFYIIEKDYFLLHDNIKGQQVICKKCELEDYIENLVIKAQ